MIRHEAFFVVFDSAVSEIHISDIAANVQILAIVFSLCGRRDSKIWRIQGIDEGHMASAEM